MMIIHIGVSLEEKTTSQGTIVTVAYIPVYFTAINGLMSNTYLHYQEDYKGIRV